MKKRRSLNREERLEIDGKYLKNLSNEMYSKLKIDKCIYEIADYFDKKIRKDGYIAYPVSIEPDYYACNYSPVCKYKITKDTVISFTIQLLRHKYDKEDIPLKCAYTTTVKNNYFNLLKHVNNACIKGISLCRADTRLINARNGIIKLLNSYKDGIKSILNLYGYNLEEYEKIIPNTIKIPTTDVNKTLGMFRDGELYYIDVYGTNLQNHEVARDFTLFPTMFIIPKYKRKNFNKRIKYLKDNKHKTALGYYDFAINKYGTNTVFSLRSLMASYRKKYGKDLKVNDLGPLNSADIMRGYPAKYVEHNFTGKAEKIQKLTKEKRGLEKVSGNEEKISKIKDEITKLQKNDCVVVHFGHTILITKGVPKLIA